MSIKYLVLETDYEYNDEIYFDSGRNENIVVFNTNEAAQNYCTRMNVDWLTGDSDGLDWPSAFCYTLNEAFSDGFIWFFNLQELWESDPEGLTEKIKDIFKLLKPEQIENIMENHITFAMPFKVVQVKYLNE